ncbi:MAG: 4Fe-4S dicluster domain-containing protein [Chloroflexi bacterium]|nr:4Fe-4S dicluster domain-containing protein [Chloroflexota bacterium]
MINKDPYHQLTESMGYMNSRVVPEILKKQVDLKEVELLLAAAPPATVVELADKTGIPTNEVEKMIEPLFIKGMIFKSKKEGVIRYYRARHVIQFHDANLLTPGLSGEVLDLWREYDQQEWPGDQDIITQFMPNAAVRILPVNVSVPIETQILAFDDVTCMVEKAIALAVVNCTCRMLHGDCGKPVEVCIQTDKAADYTLERGTGREITKDEAIEILRLCEQENLVHTVSNSRSGGNIICNCCDDCCVNWPGAIKYDTKFAAPSRFTASIDIDECTGCEACLDRCYFDAIRMDSEKETAVIVEENCMGCGLCLVACDFDALSLKETRAHDFVPD